MNTPLVRMREPGAPVRAGAHKSDGVRLDTGWHVHDLHEILYAFEGSLEIRAGNRHFLIPPQLAAFIPAGVEHRTNLKGQPSGAVLLPPSWIDPPVPGVSILRVLPLMREMILEAMRWPIAQPESEVSRHFFKALALLCAEWLKDPAPFYLPTSEDPKIRRAMTFTMERLADMAFTDVCRAVHMSERSLRRHFLKDTGMRWQEYLLRARMLEAIRLLESSSLPQSEIGPMVGFAGSSGFSRAFARFTGESPREFRRRLKKA